MNLFEKVKNIRKDLQEKKKFPGDDSGAYKAAKDDLEARKGFNKNKSGGLKADEKNPYVKRSVRKARVDKLGGDIYDAPKFTQKGFEKSIKDTQKIADKAFKSDVKKFKKIGLKPPKRGDFTSTSRPGGKLVIPDPFGKGDTPGQIRVKGLEKKAFKKTQPKDIKLPQSFKDFSTKLRRLKSDVQDFKDKDIATMRTGKSSSKVKVSGANNLSRQDVGMAPPDTLKKTKPQKGVSATEITKKYNQKRAAKASKNTMPSGKDFINKYKKQAETATTNLRKKVDTIAKNPKLTGSEKALKSRSVMKDVKTAQNFARGYANPKTVQTAITVPKDIKTVKSAAKSAITKTTKKPVLPNVRGKQISYGKSSIQKAVKALNPRAAQVLKTIGPAGRVALKRGGIAGAIGLAALSSPTVRRGVKAAIAGGTIGAFAGNKNKKAVLGPKTSGKPVKFNLSPAAKSNPNKSKYTAGVYGRPKAYS